ISNCGKVAYSKLHCGKVQRPDSAKASLTSLRTPTDHLNREPLRVTYSFKLKLKIHLACSV
ncbi:MAG TPA: hypothetical protein VJ697_14965, partial [Nitrososphaeraceae archaeon]|nr:hypothetical protein [Nitrososphaeraceae archaeon]